MKNSALEELKKIFILCNYPTESLNACLENYEPLVKDIVFLLDISKNMDFWRMKNAIQSMNSIFEMHTEKYDRLSYIVFCEIPTVIFSLLPKYQFEEHIRSHFHQVPLYLLFIFLLILPTLELEGNAICLLQ